MTRKLPTVLLLAGCLADSAALAQQTTPTASDVAPATAATRSTPSPALQRLMDTADNLRASIQDLAGRAPGPERDAAIRAAHRALLVTQQAMLDLPPAYRYTQQDRAAPGYDASVRELMAAADTLRDSIHAMAQQPAGPRRNQAIRDANRALVATQAAMGTAYDVTAFPQHGTTLGAGSAGCTQAATTTQPCATR